MKPSINVAYKSHNPREGAATRMHFAVNSSLLACRTHKAPHKIVEKDRNNALKLFRIPGNKRLQKNSSCFSWYSLEGSGNELKKVLLLYIP